MHSVVQRLLGKRPMYVLGTVTAAGIALFAIVGAQAQGGPGQGSASTTTGPAGTVVQVSYSTQPPELTSTQLTLLEARQARSNREGDVLPSAQPQAGATLGPQMPRPESLAAADSFSVFRNRILPGSGLPSPSAFSYTMEPSTGASGKNVFQTGNWYAARSLDNGATWGYLNPFTIFNDATVNGFCCDQVAIYDPGRDAMFWLLQYGNGLKIAVSRNVFSSWCYYNITPGTVGEPATTDIDYNDVALGTRYVYIATNLFKSTNGAKSVILRMPIDSLVTCAAWSGGYVKSTRDFTLKPVQGASDVMYWASDWNELTRGSSVRIFSWAENSGSYFWWDKTGLPAWSFEYRYPTSGGYGNCGSLGGGTTVKNWCQYADSRVTGGALLNGVPSPELVFSFNARQDGSHPFPYTRILRFRQSDKAFLGQGEIWSTWAAWQYSSLSPNARGDMGMNVAWGGQASGGTAYYPSGRVLIQDDYSPSQPWQAYDYVQGSGNTCQYTDTDGIKKYRWGDYLTTRPYSPTGLVWVAAGYAIKGANCGSAGWYAEPHNLVFGRGRDSYAYSRWSTK
jgi:hypothetical protein